MPAESVCKDFLKIFGGRGGESAGEENDHTYGHAGDNLSSVGSGDADSVLPNGISAEALSKLKYGAWMGNYFSKGLRGLCWRVMIGKLSYDGPQSWKTEIQTRASKYESYKKTMLPDMNRVAANHDPLTGAASGAGDWAQYYKVPSLFPPSSLLCPHSAKDLELISFIKGDLERLYMNGVADEYFKTDRRQALLLNVLFIWAQFHPQTSYRQGMHEIAAPLLLVLEEERREWSQECDLSTLPAASRALVEGLSPFSAVLCGGPDEAAGDATLEAETYWLFDRIMADLEPLYSPVTGADEQPAIVHFCTKIQEHMLRGLDPPLCRHLEENFIQAQLYGMRWSRLLLGREFELTEASLLKIWDYMFACIFDAELSLRSGAVKSGGAQPNSLAHTSLKKQHSSQRDAKTVSQGHSSAAQSKPSAAPSSSHNPPSSVPGDPLSGALFTRPEEAAQDPDEEKEESHLLTRDSDDTDDDDILWTTSSAVIKTSSRFGPSSPLLDALSDFMLAMLLHVRRQILLPRLTPPIRSATS
jgi:hypothetical protein